MNAMNPALAKIVRQLLDALAEPRIPGRAIMTCAEFIDYKQRASGRNRHRGKEDYGKYSRSAGKGVSKSNNHSLTIPKDKSLTNNIK